MPTVLTDVWVKDYDRREFSGWREEKLRQGTYEAEMNEIYGGKGGQSKEKFRGWREEDEARIEQWLSGKNPTLPEI